MGLQGLWFTSLILSAISLAIMSWLIAARLVAERKGQRVAGERARLLAFLLEPDADPQGLTNSSLSRPLLADLSVELIQLVRGEERDQMVAAAGRLGVAATIRKRLSARSPRVRVLAAESLAFFPDTESTAALERALGDRNPDVRLAAALGLAVSGRSPPARLLIERLRIGSSEQSMLIINLFQKIASDRPGEIESLITDPEMPAAVKAAAIDALAGSGDFRLVPVINQLALATDAESEHLPRYLRALGAFNHPAGAPAVRRWLNGSTWWVRAAAAEAAGRIGLEELAMPLADMLSDADWWVRFRAGEALVRLGNSGVELLAEAAEGASEPARSAARLTLAEQGIAA